MLKIFNRVKKDNALTETQKPTRFLGLNKLKKGLTKTRHGMVEGLLTLVLGKRTINKELIEEIESLLISSDFGILVTHSLIAHLTEKLSRKELSDGTTILEVLKNHLEQLLLPVAHPLIVDTSKKPFLILMVGVNGSGKTTTIGKLAYRLQTEGKSVMLAAGDTFRAAATQQLQEWGKRYSIPVVAQQQGADSASVIFDAFQSAKAKNTDVLIADTAGRLHTQQHLMSELQKIVRVLKKIDAAAPHEIMLVLDAHIGQNAIQQAQLFHQAIGITGITMTKLDGTAKGGILLAIAEKLAVPIRFIGIGESIDDIQPFEAKPFIEAMFANDEKR